MKKTLFLIITGVLTLLTSCKPNPNEATNITGVEYYYIQRYHPSKATANEYYLILNDAIDSIKNDIEIRRGEDSLIYYWSSYIPMDYLRVNEHEIILGTHFTTDMSGTDTVTTQNPYYCIDGVRKEIYFDEKVSGIYIIEEDGNYYFILEGKTVNYITPFYVSENGGTPKFLCNIPHYLHGGTATRIRNIRKFGNDYYFVGGSDNRPAFIKSGESMIQLTTHPSYGYAYEILLIDDKEYIFGFHNDTARIWVDGEMHTVPLEAEYSQSKVKCAKKIGDDIYMGGEVNGKPAIWKNQKMIGRYSQLDCSSWIGEFIGKYKQGCVANFEVIGDKIYSIAFLYNTMQNVYPCAIEWDFSGEEVVANMYYELPDLIKENEVEWVDYGNTKQYWFENTSDEGAHIWNANYSFPRINLLKK
ncbi:MAG: hypothetical protein Q4D14_00900 [Bacteroidales bacterium]|nr:hypothetical protein [Bacteroidales bacterium]